MAYTWVIVSVLACLCQLTTSQQTARLCVYSDSAKKKCDDMRNAFDGVNLRQLVCVQAPSQYACMRLIEAGQADVTKLDATKLFAAEKVFGLLPILKESKSTSANDEAYLYKAVVIVRSDSTITSLDDLYRKKSCHTGVGRTVGWTVPVSNLQAKGIMTVTNCDNTVYNVANFFSQSCAPGAYEDQNNINGDNPANVCSLCGDSRCPATDRYAGYRGSVQCLLDGVGDVAFAKHSTIDDLIKGGMNINRENYRLLCPDGSRKLIDEWNNCFWATRPTDVIARSSKLPAEAESAIRSLLSRGAEQFNNDTATFNMFSSNNYNGSNVLFTDGMKQLLGVTGTAVKTYLDPGYLNTMVNYTPCNTTVRWCVISTLEQNKCREMSAAMAADRITTRMSCVRAKSHKDCMEKIQSGTADLVTLDGGDMYTGGKHHSLVPIMAESYGAIGTTSYWAVAVVRKNNKGVNINTLKGKTSCHTGIQKTSGWNIPIGTLVEKKSIPGADTQCGIVKEVSKFFSKSCVPGALDPKYNPTGKNPANLCELCGGKDSCQRDNSNNYYSYKGAFRCLVEKNADVAFVKHTTVIDYTDGKLQDDWALTLKSSDFELLCLDGSRAPITEWQSCNLAKVPSHSVVTSSSKSMADRRHYTTILKKAYLKYGEGCSGCFRMFHTDGGHDALFDDAASGLTKIQEDQQDYRKWLGNAYTSAIAALDKKPCVSSGTMCIVPVSTLVICLFLAFNR